MQILKTREELAQWREKVTGTLGLVMTMGALHEGHLELVRAAKAATDTVVTTVFVNPTQFAPGEDFECYPRDLESDAEKLRQAGVDALFAPTEEVMYPQGAAQVCFNPGSMAKILEGKTRPTHFAGVLLVVGKMFHLVRPDVACFGKKDAQQLAIVTRMVKDLDFPLEILPVEIWREKDGLAMSSRNRYLSASERQTALELSRSLQWGLEHVKDYGSDRIAAVVQEKLNAVPGIEVDYVALVNPEGYEPITEKNYRGSATLAVAAKVGNTRLIDNMDLWL